MLEIDVQHESGEKEHYSFDKRSVMIGRAAGNDIRLQITGVSRYHARLTVEEDGVLLQDLNSTNGTCVNSEQIEQVKLTPDDSVTISGATISVSLVNGHAARGDLVEAQVLPVGITYDGDISAEDVLPISELSQTDELCSQTDESGDETDESGSESSHHEPVSDEAIEEALEKLQQQADRERSGEPGKEQVAVQDQVPESSYHSSDDLSDEFIPQPSVSEVSKPEEFDWQAFPGILRAGLGLSCR